MKYIVRLEVTEGYTQIIEANSENEAWDKADELSTKTLKKWKKTPNSTMCEIWEVEPTED